MQPAQPSDNRDANTEPQPQETADEFQDFLAQIENDEANHPTSSTTSRSDIYDEFDDFLDQIEQDNSRRGHSIVFFLEISRGNFFKKLFCKKG